MRVALFMRESGRSRRVRSAWGVLFWALFWVSALAQPICAARAAPGSEHPAEQSRISEHMHTHGARREGSADATSHHHATDHEHGEHSAQAGHEGADGACCCDELSVPAGPGPARDSAPSVSATLASIAPPSGRATGWAQLAGQAPLLDPPRVLLPPYLSTSRLRL